MKEENFGSTVNHLFRQESGKMVSVLVRIFGSAHLELVEDVVQDALLAALENWKMNGMPNNPKAWLYKTAKNKAIDIIRRKKHAQVFDFSDPQHQLLTSEFTLSGTMEDFWQENQIYDDFLGMMFACCHQAISQENQVTFILKYLCGFSVKEIARAFITSEETIAKRLQRTKDYFRKQKIYPQIPAEKEIAKNTKAVLNTIYLLFNEGYNSTHAKQLIRHDIIHQALYLCRALAEYPKTRLPEVYALMALICFHTARSKSRVSLQGELILLEDQDRSRWDKKLITQANNYLNKSAFGNKISAFHLEAAIAYEHCIAASYSTTNWQAILNYYDQLIGLTASPVVLLNRCIVILQLSGAQKALSELQAIDNKEPLYHYYLYYALVGELMQRIGEKMAAIENFVKARDLTQSPGEKEFLSARISSLQKNIH